MIMWDPETYPDVEDLEDLRDLSVTINIFAGQTYAEISLLKVCCRQIRLILHTTTPARFIAEQGAIAQQGFASSSHTVQETSMRNGARMSLSHC